MMNSSELPGDDTRSFTSARLRAVKLSTPGALLLLCIVLSGCGLAMILMGVTFWSNEHGVRGIAITGLILLSIGLGVGAGAWYIHRKLKYSREHRMPVVTISLSQNVQRENDTAGGEYNTALDVSPGYYDVLDSSAGNNARNVLNSTHSPLPQRPAQNPFQIHHHVQGPVVNIQIHGTSPTSVTTQRSHQPARRHPEVAGSSCETNHDSSPTFDTAFHNTTNNRQKRSANKTTASPVRSAAGARRSSTPRNDNRASWSRSEQNRSMSRAPNKQIPRKINSTSSTRSSVHSGHAEDVNVSVISSGTYTPDVYDSVFESDEDSPPPSYFETIADNLNPSNV